MLFQTTQQETINAAPTYNDGNEKLKDFAFRIAEEIVTFDPEIQNEMIMFWKQRIKESRMCLCKQAEERIHDAKSLIDKVSKLTDEL